jgi:hypothetical protein
LNWKVFLPSSAFTTSDFFSFSIVKRIDPRVLVRDIQNIMIFVRSSQESHDRADTPNGPFIDGWWEAKITEAEVHREYSDKGNGTLLMAMS